MGSIVSGVLGLGGVGNTGLAAAPAITQQKDLLANIATANQGVQSNIGNQNAFAQALQTQMQGGGPNLAGAQLANATGQNVANQAALMASQRGTGSNAGLIARQAAQQGAGIQQQAAGQAAVNRAGQQLNAQSQLGNVYGTIGQEQGQNLATQQGALANQNSAINQGILGTNQINSGIGQANAKNQAAAVSGIGQGLTSIPGMSGGGGGSTGSSNPDSSGGGLGSMLGSVGSLAMLAAEGGEIPKASSNLPDHLKMVSDIYHPQALAEGGGVKKIDIIVSPGEQVLEPKDVKKVAEGKANPMDVGGKVPGKPKVPGAKNDYANDTVPMKAKENSIIVPRSETKSKTPRKNSEDFVMALINKKKAKK